MAHNHRMQPVAGPYLNARRNAMSGEAFDPETEDYDLAYGPKSRVRKAIGENIAGVINPHEEAQSLAEERRMRREV